MNKLYENYPSNRSRRVEIEWSKDPNNTFIGGLFIGSVIGSIVTRIMILIF